MAFTQRIAVLAAVVAIPLGIAAASHVLTSGQDKPDVPERVKLDGPSESPTPDRPGRERSPAPSDEVVPKPSSTTDDGDDGDDGADDRREPDNADDSDDNDDSDEG